MHVIWDATQEDGLAPELPPANSLTSDILAPLPQSKVTFITFGYLFKELSELQFAK